MNDESLEQVTIKLLETLEELTPDTDINDAVVAMSVATVRIKRLQEEVDAYSWHSIEEEGLPPGNTWYDVYTYAGAGDRVVREVFLMIVGNESNESVWYKWHFAITHWRKRPAPPEGIE